MVKQIEVEWLFSPFGHAKYTLFTSEKKMRKAGFEPSNISHAITHIFDSGEIVVLINKKTDISDEEKIALIVHESVHVFQEIKERMREDKPSIEFEAYSIQTIFLGLLDLYQRS